MPVPIDDRLIATANQLAREGEDAEAVIAEALSRLAWERQEVAAVQQGIDAYERGDHEPLADFDARFREEHGLAPRR